MKKLITLSISLVFIFGLIGCGGAAPAPTTATEGTMEETPETPTDAPTDLEPVVLGVGFIPNVQFAPFYVAQSKGFYAEEGLDVSLEYGFELDFVTLTAQNEYQLAVASGDQVILGRAQGLPLVYIMAWYNRYPVGVAVPVDSGIDSPEGLVGHSVGIPGLFGASYVAWKALVYTNNLDETQIELREIGFTQVEALTQGQVDAVVSYIANEPVQLENAGTPVNVIEVSDYIDLVSNGLVTNEKAIQDNPELIGKFVRASLKGLAYTIDNPDEAFEIVRATIPEITDEDAPTQKSVLEKSIELWHSDQLGYSSPEAWADSVKFMAESGLIESEIEEVENMYTNQFLSE